MIDWSAQRWRGLIDAAPEGVVLCEVRPGEFPVVYVNSAFEQLSGYALADLLGSDLRRVLGTDAEQPARARLHEALQHGTSARLLLHDYRRDGSPYWNELLLAPLRDDGGELTHFVGFCRDMGERDAAGGARSEAGLPTWMREDRLSGLCARAYFEELLRRDWLVGLREGRTLMLMVFDIDALGAFNDTFGKSAGDACIRRVAGVISAAFRRGTDVVARWEGGTICALVRSADAASAAAYASAITQRVYSLHIHHPRSPRQRFVSVSAAVACMVPSTAHQPATLLQAGMAALRRARQQEPGVAVVAGTAEFDAVVHVQDAP